MNVLLFEPAERCLGGYIEVTGRRLQHLLEVHRAAVGDNLRVGEIGGCMGEGTVLEIDAAHARLQVTLSQPPPERNPVSLVVALPRPKMLRRILRASAEFGITDVHLINSYRVEKSYWQTPILEPQMLREVMLPGIEQARDTLLPTVHCHRRFKPWVEDTLPAIAGKRQALLAHPGDYPPCPEKPEADALLIIGPEGGFIEYEVDKLVTAGCTPVSLGNRILRVENAVIALLGRCV